MSSLLNVTKFEVLRSLKKKSFWYTTIALPVIIIVIFGINYASSSHASKSSQEQTTSYSKTARLGVFDETGLTDQQSLSRQHIVIEPSEQTGIANVQNGRLTAFFYYPKDVSKAGIQVYAQDQGLTFAPPYDTIATQLLKQSAVATISAAARNPQAVQILQKDPVITATTYKNGKQSPGLASLVAPGAIWIVFLVLVIMLSYFTIAATTEEKENRAAEILLTSIKSRNLISGKIVSIFALEIVQVIAIAVPLLIAYALFRSHITLPGGISLSHIPLDIKAITFGVLFLLFGLVLYTGILVGFSSLFPSAQDAGRYLFLVIIWVFIPLYALGYVVSSPDALIVAVFTYFPLTAPTTVLLRNAIGTISTAEELGSLAILMIAAVLAIMFAVRAFRSGAMAYSRRISIKEIFK